MSINRRLNIMVATAVVFMFMVIIFCWGSTEVNHVMQNNKVITDQLRGG